MDIERYKKSLDDKLWRTKGARFNAHRRLARKQSLVVFVTSASSIHLISLSIFQISGFFCLTELQSYLLSLTSIIVSIVILVYGLIEGGKNYGLLSEVHHRCGLDIDRLYKQIFLSDTVYELKKLSREYDNLLEKHSTNHNEIDDLYFQSCHPKEFPCLNYPKWVHFRFNYKDFSFAFLVVIIPIFISFWITNNFWVELWNKI